MTTDRHKFVGQLNMCIRCLKKSNDPIHLYGEHKHTCEVCQREVPCTDGICTLPEHIVCSFCTDLRPGAILEKAIEKTQTDINVADVYCSGHKCPSCESTWRHDYKCGNTNLTGLCQNCAQVTAAHINRPKNLEVIVKHQTLTAKESSELSLQYREFMVKNFALQEDGKTPRPESETIDLIMNHIQNLRNIQEKSRINEREALELLAETQTKEAMKISPDQREDFKRLADRNKRRDAETEIAKSEKKVAKKEKYKNEIADILKRLGKKVDPDLLNQV